MRSGFLDERGATTSRPRDLLGLVSGFLLAADAAAHSVPGWREMHARLAATDAPADLVTRLAIGWHFGGAAMLTFAGLVVWIFARRLRGRDASLGPALAIAVVYVTCAAGALLASGLNPVYTLFLGPGLALLAASWRPDAATTAR